MSWKTIKLSIIAITVIGLFFVVPAFAASTGTIDSTDKYAWGENIGWINFGADEGDVALTDTGITGYAWGENIGWISLDCSNTSSCDTVDYGVENDGDGNLSGYAWGENTGWIDFSPDYGGVSIDSSGNFSGYAWGENIGWIVFNCSTTSSCDTVDYKVKTDYTPQSGRAACDNGADDDGDGKIDYPDDPGCASAEDSDETDAAEGGGGLSPAASSPPTPPAPTPEAPEGFQVVINSDDLYTNNRQVSLELKGGIDTAKMAVSNFADFFGAAQEVYSETKEWNLCGARSECPEGIYTIYAKFFTQYGQSSATVADSIILTYEPIPAEEPTPAPVPIPAPGMPFVPAPPAVGPIYEPSIISKIPEFLKNLLPDFLKPISSLEVGETIMEKLPKPFQLLIPEFLKTKVPQIQPNKLPDITKLVPKTAPLAFSSHWILLPREPINKFVLAPLPGNVQKLTKQFPQLEKTFSEVGINKITDLGKLSSTIFNVPGLTETAGIPKTQLETGKLVLPAGIKIADLTADLKKKIPSEVVFAKTAGELIDFNFSLSVTPEGQPRQKISTIVGKPLTLVVKPEGPVNSVKGYMVFKYRRPQARGIAVPLASLIASPAFAEPAFAQEAEDSPLVFVEGGTPRSDVSVRQLASAVEIINTDNPEEQGSIENRLVLMEFEYIDPDGDGIYTAEIFSPSVDGEYEVITIMDYKDPLVGKKEIRLTTVVDPEGYVYEKFGDKEIRVPGAIVEISWLNPGTKQYESWPARNFQQENPQVTDTTGKYSFLVPEGSYYIAVDAPGYLSYESKPFQVKEGSGVHFNVELKTKYWWFKIVDWKTLALVLVILLLLYNFYKDRRRDKLLNK